MEGAARRFLAPLLALAPLVLMGTPATAVEVIREPTTLFVSAPIRFPDDDLIRADGVLVAAVPVPED